MGYIRFPQIEGPHAFKMCSTPLKKICTEETHSHANGTIPKKIHLQKRESSKAIQIKESIQTDEPVVPKIKWNTDSTE